MASQEIKIRDFGEKVRYLVGTKSVKACENVEELPPEFVEFQTEKQFSKWLDIEQATLNQWRNDQRDGGRLPPKLEKAIKIAQLFGIYPKDDRSVDIITFWKKVWPSWYSDEAGDQYFKNTTNSRKKSSNVDTVDAFKEAYSNAINMHIKDRQNSILNFNALMDRGALRQKAIRDIAKIINRHPEVLTYLQQLGGLTAMPLRCGENLDDSTIQIATEWLIDCHVDDLLPACQKAFIEIFHNEDVSDANVLCIVLSDLAQRIIPAIYHSYSSFKIRLVIDGEIGGLIELPACRPSVAEIFVASAEFRETKYLPRSDRETWPAGIRSFIDSAPDDGIDEEDKVRQDVARQLTRSLTVSDGSKVYKAIRHFILGRKYYKAEPELRVDDDASFNLACATINNRILMERRAYYMLFYVPNDNVSRKKLEEIVNKLQKKIPRMMFLAMTNDSNLLEKEHICFQPFISILPVSKNEKRSDAKTGN